MKMTKNSHRFSLLAVVLPLLGACGEGAPGVSPDVETLADPIIGGTFAIHGEFPHQVLLTSSLGVLCGGSIVADDWVLTAAHCVSGTSASTWTARAGMVTRSPAEPEAQTRRGAQISIHPHYDALTAEYDVALLKLSAPWTRTAFVAPVEISTRPARPGEVGTVSGWGVTSAPGGSVSSRLKRTSLPVRADAECSAAGLSLGDAMICANTPGTTTSDCYGDSGGPLVIGARGAWKQVGIVSWGVEFCDGYSVFTDLWEVASWVRAQLSGLRADINRDGCVDDDDYAILAAHFGEPTTAATAAADINADGVIDVRDYTLLLDSWGVGC